jgi:hypothetical protein
VRGAPREVTFEGGHQGCVRGAVAEGTTVREDIEDGGHRESERENRWTTQPSVRVRAKNFGPRSAT